MSGGKLCISVIEAKNVLAADTASDLSFYVKLRLGSGEVKTDVCYNSGAPKFLKDVRMAVPAPETDTLRVEMLQLGPRGDLVVGGAEIRVLNLVNKGTVVQWLDLKAFNQSVGAQLCCVLRFLSAEANRPLTPSYAIATREARERAVGAAVNDVTLHAPGPTAARALFSDSTPATPKSAEIKAQGLASEVPPTPAPVDLATAKTSKDTPTQSKALAPDKTFAVAAAAVDNDMDSVQQEPEQQKETSKTALRIALWPRQLLEKSQISMPLAVASGMLFGMITYILKRRSSPMIFDDEGVCMVSSCFNKTRYDKYKSRLENGLD